MGLDQFSHVEVIHLSDQFDLGGVQTGAHHPRGNMDWPVVGIFAQRRRAGPTGSGSKDAGCSVWRGSRCRGAPWMPSTAHPYPTARLT